jgi:hypothetical protein
MNLNFGQFRQDPWCSFDKLITLRTYEIKKA